MTALSPTGPSRRALRARVAFGLLTSILVTLLASSSAPTPLYATYQARWGFSPVTITVIFGVYAVAVLASLLVAGSLSDHVGRRPVLIGALGTQAMVMLLFAFAGGIDVLLALEQAVPADTGGVPVAAAASRALLPQPPAALDTLAAPLAGTVEVVALLPRPSAALAWDLGCSAALKETAAPSTEKSDPVAASAAEQVAAVAAQVRGNWKRRQAPPLQPWLLSS